MVGRHFTFAFRLASCDAASGDQFRKRFADHVGVGCFNRDRRHRSAAGLLRTQYVQRIRLVGSDDL